MKFFKAEVIFEASTSLLGSHFLIIFGKHSNGYFCCIPNWGVGCEMAEPDDVFYNTERLQEHGLLMPVTAREVAKEIKRIAEGLKI